MVPSYLQMANLGSNSMSGKVMYLELFSEAHTQVYTEFLHRLVYHDYRHGLCTVIVIFISATSKKSATAFTRKS